MPGNRKVLVVDDDIVQCGIIEAVALRAGFKVSCVSTFDDAIAKIAGEPFEFVTVDLSLGDRNGIELLGRLADISPRPRIIVVSASDRRILNATSRMAVDFGLHDVVALSKPLDLKALKSALLDVEAPQKRARFIAAQAIDGDHLKEAISACEITVAFQPKVRLSDGAIVGCEALARWHSKTLGFVPPDQFIAAAEANGLIVPITRCIMRDALSFTREMLERDDKFVCAINLSAIQLSDLSILQDIQDAVADSGVSPRNVILEITETAAIADASAATEVLLQLRLKGFGVSIDDFGTGYSSLSMLSRMPFTELKIDRSFVKDCLIDPAMFEIVRSSIELAHHLDMKTVAEGIETADIARELSALGCQYAQGYLYSSAISAHDFLTHYDSSMLKTNENAALVA